MAALQAGTQAPNFKLPDSVGQKTSLSDFAGKPVILVFYPADWSPVCGDQLALYNELLPDFKQYNAEIIALSVDSPWCHSAYAKQKDFQFPLLSDFEPKGQIAKTYGVYQEKSGTCERALFVIDPKGMIRWSYVSPAGINPGAEGILEALESLKKIQTT